MEHLRAGREQYRVFPLYVHSEQQRDPKRLRLPAGGGPDVSQAADGGSDHGNLYVSGAFAFGYYHRRAVYPGCRSHCDRGDRICVRRFEAGRIHGPGHQGSAPGQEDLPDLQKISSAAEIKIKDTDPDVFLDIKRFGMNKF